MKGRYYWHIHHEKLLERLRYPVAERVLHIKTDKPQNEQELRLALMKRVKGPVPDKKTQARIKTLEKKLNAFEVSANRTRMSYKQYNRMATELHRIKQFKTPALAKYITALHKKECKNCPWKGKKRYPLEGNILTIKKNGVYVRPSQRKR